MLAALSVLDSDPDPDFDRLTRLASQIFDVPVALITLLDVERQWFMSKAGLDDDGTATDISFCAHTIASKHDYMVVEDTTLDERFADNPLVTGPHHVRFYAGAPVVVRGQRIGALCVLAPQAKHDVPQKQLQQLADLAATASSLFELKDEARVRARTAAALIREEWRHALTLEAGRVGSWVWDLRTDEVVANDILRRMFELPVDVPMTGRDMLGNVHVADRPGVDEALRAAFDDGIDYVSEFRVDPTGRWLLGRGRVYQRDGNGKPLIMMGVHLDLTETREAAEHTRLLLRELNHRVKNTLAMIQSLARQTMRRNPDPERFIDAFSGRLRTLSESHALLSDRDWSGIGLLELVGLQVRGDVDLQAEQIELNGEDVFLPPDHALGLGLVLHELASNAARFGALSVPEGRVVIRWIKRQAPDLRVELQWTETGGPPVVEPQEYGLGGKLIERSLAKVLDSSVELTFPQTGVEARISFPLPVEA
jgi:two-component sensor histidine kinase